MNSELQTSLKSVRELVFILENIFLVIHHSLKSSYREVAPQVSFFLPLYHIYLYLFTITHFFQNRNGDQSQIQLSQDTLETFSWDSQECMNLCVYCILHIAHLYSYCIVFLWFWLIKWGEFLGSVLDWNVKTNQWQIAWTHSNWHL